MPTGTKVRPTKAPQTRHFTLHDVEIREESGAKGTKLRFSGYAAVFNALSDDLGGFREKIKPGAFRKTIQEADVRLLLNHDSSLVLARSKAGTLSLEEDSKGLYVEAEMAPTSYAQDLSLLMQRGDIDQMSFGFQVVRDEWNEKTSPPTRTLLEVKLFDVSIVSFPAYPQTSGTVRGRRTQSDINREHLRLKMRLIEMKLAWDKRKPLTRQEVRTRMSRIEKEMGFRPSRRRSRPMTTFETLVATKRLEEEMRRRDPKWDQDQFKAAVAAMRRQPQSEPRYTFPDTHGTNKLTR